MGMSALSSQFLCKRKTCLKLKVHLRKRLIPRLEQRQSKMSLECLVMAGSKKMLRT